MIDGTIRIPMPALEVQSAAHPLSVIDWGRVGYAEALRRQEDLVKQRLEGQIGDVLVFTEHDPVYTIGRRMGAMQHLLASPEELAAQGIEVVKTTRGGDITYHGPGQVVGYPIISLDARRDLHLYMRGLEGVIIRALAEYGLAGERREGWTGIWVGRRKIAAIGVAVRRWVTYHGFALNVDVELAAFGGIVPCGIPASVGEVTSMTRELGQPVDIVGLKQCLAVEFRRELANSLVHGYKA